MTLQSVNIDQVDGALGVSGDSSGDVFAVLGTATAGAVNYPVAFVNPQDIINYFGSGPLVEHACYLAGGKPVICIRMATVTDGSCGTIDVSGWLGTSVATIHTGAKADFEYDIIIKAITGGTVGTAGIVLQYSKDGGYSWSQDTALGTANTFTVPETGGVQFDFAAGTILAGAVAKTRTVAPKEDATSAAAAQLALRQTHHQWDAFHVATVQDAAGITVWDNYIADLWSRKKHKKGVVFVRGPNIGETEAQWQTALATIRTNATSIYLAVCAGYGRMTSRAKAGKFRAPIALAFSKRAAAESRPTRTDLAEPKLGPIPDLTLFDRNGALVEHNEFENPGLDELHYVTCRTIEGKSGTYFEKPRIFCPKGSDYYLWQYRSVINRAADSVQVYLVDRLRSPLQVDSKTGFIKKSEAKDIEKGGMASIRDVVSNGPDASDYSFAVSRTDNLLAIGAVCHVTVRLVPLVYPNNFGVTIGFVNPARGAL